MGHLHNKYDNKGNMIDQYDDNFDRELAVNICEEILHEEFYSNGVCDTDLRSKTKPELYVELEHGSWSCNHAHSSQADRFSCNCQTINVPERKFFNWDIPFRHSYIISGREHMIYNPTKIIHFGRFNAQYDQFILVRHEILMDKTKWIMKYDQETGKSKVLEDFICIPIEYCEIYNKQLNGKWVLNGEYCGEEIQRLRIQEVMKMTK